MAASVLCRRWEEPWISFSKKRMKNSIKKPVHRRYILVLPMPDVSLDMGVFVIPETK